MFNYIVLAFFIIILSACSGKVQTNPEPNLKKFNLPNTQVNFTTSVNQKFIDDYELYVKEFFKMDRPNYKKSIWTIGIEGGYYD